MAKGVKLIHAEPDADDRGSLMSRVKNADNDADDKKMFRKFVKAIKTRKRLPVPSLAAAISAGRAVAK